MPLFKYLIWALILPFTIVIGLIGRVLAPIVCLFVVRNLRTDTVKRLGKATVTLNRDNLSHFLYWFDTFDNATDEYWYGCYDNTVFYTQEFYDNSAIYRWYCRVMWLWRNSMYGFNYKYISIAKDSWLAWHYKGQVSLPFNLKMHVNVGWKAFKEFDNLMFAGRFIGRITKNNKGF